MKEKEPDHRDREQEIPALFINLGVATGFWTIVIAHIMFNISFVVVTVKPRIVGLDRHLEEAAMDVGANEWSTFRR